MAKRGRKPISELMKAGKEIDWTTYGTIYSKNSKYTKGERITNFNEFINQDVFITGNQVRNKAWLLNQQLRVALNFFSGGVYYAIPKEKKENKGVEIKVRKDYFQSSSYRIVIFDKDRKYYLKFDSDNFMIELTEKQVREICEDMDFENMVKNEGGAICYVPLAQRIRDEYIAKKFNMEE